MDAKRRGELKKHLDATPSWLVGTVACFIVTSLYRTPLWQIVPFSAGLGTICFFLWLKSWHKPSLTPWTTLLCSSGAILAKTIVGEPRDALPLAWAQCTALVLTTWTLLTLLLRPHLYSMLRQQATKSGEAP